MVTAPTGDPENFFTTCALDDSVSNNGHYHSDKLEELAKELRKEFDVEKRSELGVLREDDISKPLIALRSSVEERIHPKHD